MLWGSLDASHCECVWVKWSSGQSKFAKNARRASGKVIASYAAIVLYSIRIKLVYTAFKRVSKIPVTAMADNADTTWWHDKPFHVVFGTTEPLPKWLNAEALHSVVLRHGYGAMEDGDKAISMWTNRGKLYARVRFRGVQQNSEYLDRNVKIVAALRAGKSVGHTYKSKARDGTEENVTLWGSIDAKVSQLEPPDVVKVKDASGNILEY